MIGLNKIENKSIKQEIVDEMHHYYKTLDALGELMSKFYEKFMLEYRDKKIPNFENYYKIRKNSIIITDEFYDDINVERSEIGQDINSDNYNQIDQLKNKDLHRLLFEFGESKGIKPEKFVKLYGCKLLRNNEMHLNLPSINNIDHLKRRMNQIKNQVVIDEDFERKVQISQDDFNLLIEAIIQ